jgi:hypothetical protein
MKQIKWERHAIGPILITRQIKLKCGGKAFIFHAEIA